MKIKKYIMECMYKYDLLKIDYLYVCIKCNKLIMVV